MTEDVRENKGSVDEPQRRDWEADYKIEMPIPLKTRKGEDKQEEK